MSDKNENTVNTIEFTEAYVCAIYNGLGHAIDCTQTQLDQYSEKNTAQDLDDILYLRGSISLYRQIREELAKALA